MAAPEIRFIGPEYDGAESQLGSFGEKLVRIVKEFAGQKYGQESALIPTDIEIAPIDIQNDRMFIIRSWVETASSSGQRGIIQPSEGAFELAFDSTDAYLHHRVENGSNYKLTTVEAMTIIGLGHMAAEQAAVYSLPHLNQ